MVKRSPQHSEETRAPQGTERDKPDPNKIGASTRFDFSGKNLTPYGGLLPVATMLEKLGLGPPPGGENDEKAESPENPEEKWQIVLEGLKSGNVAETCRKYEIAPNLYYRWKDEVEAGAKAALGGRSAAARPDAEQEKRIKQLERALGRSHLQIEILKNVLGE
jgi:putative transposase